ncbi:hypothetical protein LU293_05815 [Moraxella nasovis]|uniref:hypothetical protein n=1 Tax=Moraxella nasovis TaxID=2904121 RepID=UPI001F6163B2|nr:hypothetical protein [Moraxella nasovis]UNU72634.1 hypothetical protein LU293_05815 [Moraxella nasovis]
MFWELIATIVSGFMAAGIALSLRLLFKKLPRWIVPAAAGVGMLGFQIYSEYDWFEHTKSRLPDGVAVVATHAETAFYKPWSYAYAPILRFVAVETSQKQTDHIKAANLYFFERRMAAYHTPILVDCQNKLQSDFNQAPSWGKTPMTDDIVKAVCQ